MRKSAQNLNNWHNLWIQFLPSTLKCSLWTYPYSTLSKLSVDTKIAQFENYGILWGSSQESLGTLSVQKRELLGWKHPRAQSFGEGRLDEEGN